MKNLRFAKSACHAALSFCEFKILSCVNVREHWWPFSENDKTKQKEKRRMEEDKKIVYDAEKIVYDAEESVFSQLWPFKTKDKSQGVTMGKITEDLANGFDERDWAGAKLPPGVLECCIDEALRQLNEKYEKLCPPTDGIWPLLTDVKLTNVQLVYHLFSTHQALCPPPDGILPLLVVDVNLKSVKKLYHLVATHQALVVLKEKESKKHAHGARVVVVVEEDDDTSSTASMVDGGS